MQRLVGIFREEADLAEALTELDDAPGAAGRDPRQRRTGLQPGLEPRLRAAQPADRVRGHHPQRQPADARAAGRTAGSTSRRPTTTAWGHRNSVISKAPDGAMTATTAPLPGMPDALRDLLGTH